VRFIVILLSVGGCFNALLSMINSTFAVEDDGKKVIKSVK